MRATAIGVVLEAGPGSSFKPGDSVLGTLGSSFCSVFWIG